MGRGAPAEWFRTSLAPNYQSLYWEQGGEEKVELALAILQPEGHERILDLACATGRRTLELARRGFEVFGTDVRQSLLEIPACEAEGDGLWPWFAERDTRDLEFHREFDIVLSLGPGAFGHFDYDEDDLRAFARAARALRPGGRLLMQTPNLPYVESRLSERTWLLEGRAVSLVEQRWDPNIRRIDGSTISIFDDELFEEGEPVPFQHRVYSLEELFEIFASVGLRLSNVFDEDGAACVPDETQQEIYVEAHVDL